VNDRSYRSHKKNMKYLIAAIFAFSCFPCLAQNNQKERTCRIIFLERPHGAPEEVQLFDGKQSHKVTLSSMNFSEVIKLPGEDLVLAMTPNPVLGPADFPVGAPTVKIPERITDFYLIVVSDPTNKILPIRMQAVDAGMDLKPGQTLWINLTTHTIAGKLGNENLEIQPGARVIGNAPLAANGYYRAVFAYKPERGDGYLPVMRKSWWFDAKSKNLGFIINSGGRLPKIFTFRDHRVTEVRKKPE